MTKYPLTLFWQCRSNDPRDPVSHIRMRTRESAWVSHTRVRTHNLNIREYKHRFVGRAPFTQTNPNPLRRSCSICPFTLRSTALQSLRGEHDEHHCHHIMHAHHHRSGDQSFCRGASCVVIIVIIVSTRQPDHVCATRAIHKTIC